MKNNWFNTLREALDSEGLSDLWPWESSIAYGQNVRHIVEHEGETRLISVYRETDGRYERPVHYVTSGDKKERDVYRDAARYRALVDNCQISQTQENWADRQLALK